MALRIAAHSHMAHDSDSRLDAIIKTPRRILITGPVEIHERI